MCNTYIYIYMHKPHVNYDILSYEAWFTGYLNLLMSCWVLTCDILPYLSLIRILESKVHVSLIRRPSFSWRACHAKLARLFVRSWEIDILALGPLACCTGLFLRFLHVFINHAFVLRLASFTIMGRGRTCAADAASPSVVAASSDGSGWGGGLPRRWASSMSSSTNLGLTFVAQLQDFLIDCSRGFFRETKYPDRPFASMLLEVIELDLLRLKFLGEAADGLVPLCYLLSEMSIEVRQLLDGLL